MTIPKHPKPRLTSLYMLALVPIVSSCALELPVPHESRINIAFLPYSIPRWHTAPAIAEKPECQSCVTASRATDRAFGDSGPLSDDALGRVSSGERIAAADAAAGATQAPVRDDGAVAPEPMTTDTQPPTVLAAAQIPEQVHDFRARAEDARWPALRDESSAAVASDVPDRSALRGYGSSRALIVRDRAPAASVTTVTAQVQQAPEPSSLVATIAADATSMAATVVGQHDEGSDVLTTLESPERLSFSQVAMADSTPVVLAVEGASAERADETQRSTTPAEPVQSSAAATTTAAAPATAIPSDAPASDASATAISDSPRRPRSAMSLILDRHFGSVRDLYRPTRAAGRQSSTDASSGAPHVARNDVGQ